MNESPRPSTSSRSTLLRAFRWLFTGHGIRRMLIVLAWTVTAIALLYAEENWRGQRAWHKYRQKLEAHGEQLDLKMFIPKPVPDEQNFAANPFVESWFLERTNTEHRWQDNYSKVAGSISTPSPIKDKKGIRQPLDLVAWQKAFEAFQANPREKGQKFESGQLERQARAKAAPTVLEFLKGSETNLAQLRAASQRPSVRYPIVYDLENPWGIFLPHLSNLSAACRRLELRACAELAAGQNDLALGDVKFLLYLADSVAEEVFLITYVSRLANLNLAIQPIWEGLVEHVWSEAQLQEIQKYLQRYDLLAELKSPLAGERAAGILTAELLYRQKYTMSTLVGAGNGSGGGSWTADLFGRMAPHGWYYQEQRNYCRLYEMQLDGTFDAAKRRVYPKQIEAAEHELEREIGGGWLGKAPKAVLHHQLLAALMLPALNKIPIKAAKAQTGIDHAVLACAIERYRMANGELPETLEALKPRFIAQLPNDVLSGAPYKYHRRNTSEYILYSVGWNEQDDGGVPGKTMYDETGGDWVW